MRNEESEIFFLCRKRVGQCCYSYDKVSCHSSARKMWRKKLYFQPLYLHIYNHQTGGPLPNFVPFPFRASCPFSRELYSCAKPTYSYGSKKRKHTPRIQATAPSYFQQAFSHSWDANLASPVSGPLLFSSTSTRTVHPNFFFSFPHSPPYYI